MSWVNSFARRFALPVSTSLFASALVQVAHAKKIICVDGCNSSFVNEHEGYERGQMAAGDMIQIGGNLKDCLAMVGDNDTLIIIAHGAGSGQGFMWGGTKYTGFDGGPQPGATPHPVPMGFNNHMGVTVRFCSCWSARDPDGGGANVPLTDKIVGALGGAGNGNTAGGYNDYATVNICWEFTGGDANKAAANLNKNKAWRNNPPTNRPGATTTQQTAGQAQLEARFPGVYKFKITGYKAPANMATLPAASGGAVGCECENEAPFCGFGIGEWNTYAAQGSGGLIPATGSGNGTWPSLLPSAPMVSTATLPSNALSIDVISIEGVQHTWLGDLHITLEDPLGRQHTLLHRPGFTGAGFGFDCDLLGSDYSLIQIYAPLQWPPTVGGGCVLAAGGYNQLFGYTGGVWPNAVNNIYDTPLSNIPVMPGAQYVLRIYDWAAGDVGMCMTWHMAGKATPLAPMSYCTPGTSSSSCLTGISATGNPSVSYANGCDLLMGPMEGQKSGLLFYGISGPNSASWGLGSTSFLCAKAPTQRTSLQTSGGTAGTCSGAMALDWNQYQQTHLTALGNPWSVGNQVWAQGWYRDPVAIKTTNLSNAVQMTYVP